MPTLICDAEVLMPGGPGILGALAELPGHLSPVQGEGIVLC